MANTDSRRTAIRWLIAATVLLIGTVAVWLRHPTDVASKRPLLPATDASTAHLDETSGIQQSREGAKSIAQPAIGNPSSNISARVERARELIHKLRNAATNMADVQALCLANAAVLEQLRLLGADAVPAHLAEIVDRTSPASLRILLIEMVAHLGGRHDSRIGQALMAIITDDTDDKGVRMQALQWIPKTGEQTAGATLLEMLPKQTDADLEFGITRAMRGFKVPDSVGILKGELADQKGYLIRIAATHAVAAQGGQDALTLLQNSLASQLATDSQENHPEENSVSLHAILALGEMGDVSSLPLLEGMVKNPANSVSVRNTAIQTIATIGGPDAMQFLRRALQDESNESVLVYIARAMSLRGERADASACLGKAASVSDSYTKTELQKAAQELQQKVTR